MVGNLVQAIAKFHHFKFGNITAILSCPLLSPKSDTYLDGTTSDAHIMMGVSGGLTLTILVLYLENSWYSLRHYRFKRLMILSLLLTGLHPVFALTSLVALLIPRSSLVNEFISSAYLSVCLCLFMRLVVRYHGGENNLLRQMESNEVPLQSGSTTCCCSCCPKVEPTRRVLYRIKFSVLQIALVHPVVFYISTILWTDGRYFDGRMSLDHPHSYLSVIRGLSTILAICGLVLMYRVSSKRLKRLHILPKFIILKLVLVFSDLQRFVFAILTHFNLPPCQKNISSPVRGKIIYHTMLISEMFLLMLVARYYYRKTESPIDLVGPEMFSSQFNILDRREVKRNIKGEQTRAVYPAARSESYVISL